MENILKEKSYAFALRVVKLAQYLNSNKKEYVLSRQVLRSGTAIGALISEAEFAQSKPDFVNKLSVGLKEANETHYWLKLLNESNYISESMYNSIQPQSKEIIKLLVTSINTAKKNI
jgi:four helix bundle protein